MKCMVMIQEVLTYIVLLFSVYLLIKKGINFFRKPATHCDGCFQSKSGCKVADLKKSIKPGKTVFYKNNYS